MWIFSRQGFFSIACADKPGRGRKIDPETVMVRARVKQHLKNLQNRFRKSKTLRSIARTPIEKTLLTDYRYRLILPKAVWVQALGELAMEQTWSNFKDEAQKFERKNKQSPDYVDALHDIWSVMHWLQVREGLVASPPRKVTHGKR
jgi:hypothetical protein